MWSTTEDDNTLVNLSAMGAVRYDGAYKIWALSPDGTKSYLLLHGDDKRAVKAVFDKLKKDKFLIP